MKTTHTVVEQEEITPASPRFLLLIWIMSDALKGTARTLWVCDR